MEQVAQYCTRNINSAMFTDIIENDTDLTNAKWFILEHGLDVKYCTDFGKWLKWDGKRWTIASSEELLHLAAVTAENMAQEASSERNKELLQRALRLQNVRRMRSMLEVVASDPCILIGADRLDTDPFLLNCQNGTINLQSGEFREHQREDLITKLCNASYNPEAGCELWLKFLNRIMDNNAELVDFLQKAIGYSLTASTSEQVFFLLHGTGKNGKSTLVDTLTNILNDYAIATPMSTFLSKNNDSIRNDVARLRGGRLITAQESDQERRLSEALLKQLTGGDVVVARYLHAEFFEFKLEGKIWLSSNYKPEVRDTSEGFWRRVRLLPFSITIPETERVKGFADHLLIERDGILSWAVEGCKKWMQEGLASPDAVTEATSDYRKQSDVLSGFIEDRCLVSEQVRVNASSLYDAFKAWCDRNGEGQVTQRKFGLMMAEKGFRKTKSNSKTWYLNIALSDLGDD